MSTLHGRAQVEAYLDRLFPHTTMFGRGGTATTRKGRGRATGTSKKKAAAKHPVHGRGHLDRQAAVDAWRHIGQASGQG